MGEGRGATARKRNFEGHFRGDRMPCPHADRLLTTSGPCRLNADRRPRERAGQSAGSTQTDAIREA